MNTELAKKARKLRIETRHKVSDSSSYREFTTGSLLVSWIERFCKQYNVRPNEVEFRVATGCDSWHPDAEPKTTLHLLTWTDRTDEELTELIAAAEQAKAYKESTKTERKEKALVAAQNRVEKLNKELGRLL